MSKQKIKPLRFNSFEDFYTNMLLPFKAENPTFQRLDGMIGGSNRSAFAYFNYNKRCWKIDADTSIEKLELAYNKREEHEQMFIEKPTRNNKNICLELTGEKPYRKKFYVYLTGLSVD